MMIPTATVGMGVRAVVAVGETTAMQTAFGTDECETTADMMQTTDHHHVIGGGATRTVATATAIAAATSARSGHVRSGNPRIVAITRTKSALYRV
jgi:Ethanolamine utilization protein EutJ (predicted chaperonin)